MTRNRIMGGIGLAWGGAVILSRLISPAESGDGAYASGSAMGLVFGALLALAGVYYLLKG